MVLDGSTLSRAELIELFDAPSVYVDAGCDLLDANDVFLEDISADLIASGSSVSRNIYRTLHGTCTLRLSRELDWGAQRVRPFMLRSSDGVTWYRFNLGVFLLATPEREASETPATWTVAGYDKLDILNVPLGSGYALNAGSVVLDAVRDLIDGAGESKVLFDPAAASTTTPSARVFPMDDQMTLLGLMNGELLNSIGYRALYVDRDGWYRSESYRPPVDLPIIWDYSADSATTTVGQHRVRVADFYDAVNVVTAINDDPEADTIPVASDGIVTVELTDGPTSIEARGGRRIPRVIRGKYVDQAALEVAAQEILDNEKRITTYVKISTSPNPIHGHFDVVNYRDDVLGLSGPHLVTDWTLPLDASDMSLSLKAV